jgi:hypothetical protein
LPGKANSAKAGRGVARVGDNAEVIVAIDRLISSVTVCQFRDRTYGELGTVELMVGRGGTVDSS